MRSNDFGVYRQHGCGVEMNQRARAAARHSQARRLNSDELRRISFLAAAAASSLLYFGRMGVTTMAPPSCTVMFT